MSVEVEICLWALLIQAIVCAPPLVPDVLGPILPGLGTILPGLGPILPGLGPILPGLAPPLHVPPSECRSLMDIMLVVDGSDSIAAYDYIQQREALAGMISEMDIGPTRARVGIVVYSSAIAQVVPLNANKQLLINKASHLVHPRDGTRTSLGISTMRAEFQKNGRPLVPWVSITITDGISKDRNKTAVEAELSRQLGINMFAVGISHDIDKNELLGIASSPDQVLMLTSFDQLRLALRDMMKVVCPCPMPPPLPFGMVTKGLRSVGTVRTYVCKPGFQPMGDPDIICLKDAVWSPLKFGCRACPKPMPAFGNAVITKGRRHLDTVREYVCIAGFVSPKPLLTTCIAGPNGPFWTEPEFVCSSCPVPMDAPFSTLDLAGNTLLGATRGYMCNKGFIPTGPMQTTCIEANGIPFWSEVLHSCIACKHLPIIPNAIADPSGITLVGTVRSYSCEPGFIGTGPIDSVCVGEHGATHWSMPDHMCIACKHPPGIPHGILVKPGSTLVGDVRTYTCVKGFMPTGPLAAVCIGDQGQAFWKGPLHGCVACDAPPLIPNAIVDPLGDSLIGTVRRYMCMDGFIPTGAIEVGCITATGGPLWTAPEFMCITCDMPPPLPHAILGPGGDNRVGSTRLYMCEQGFVPTLPGPIKLTCIGEKGHAFWSPPSHQCIACQAPPILESAAVDPGPDVNLVGNERRYACRPGFHATGPILIRCLPDATWSIPEHSCTACGPTPGVPFADIKGGLHLVGAVRTYVCHNGYTPSAPPMIECLPNAQWSPVNFHCVACRGPEPVDFAVVEPGRNLIGSVRTYTCLPGYLASGPITSTCVSPPDAVLPRIPTWSAPVHYCGDCGEPYEMLFAHAIPGRRTIGTTQIYRCIDGYVPSAPPHSHCLPNARWAPPNFQCVACGDPPQLLNALVDNVGVTLVGSLRTYTCSKGYLATGPMEIRCVADQADGYQTPYWSERSKHHCRDCGPPPAVTNGVWMKGATTLQSAADYVCHDGYRPSGPPQIVCQPTAQWSIPAFVCTGCFSPPAFPKAVLVGPPLEVTLVGHKRQYLCEAGYLETGPVAVTCLDTLTWSHSLHGCRDCGEPPPVTNGLWVAGPTTIQARAQYICLDGYVPSAAPHIVCQPNGKWTVAVFKCTACFLPPELHHAVLIGSPQDITLVGQSRQYACHAGYLETGPISIMCRDTLDWSAPLHACKDCGEPPILTNAVWVTGPTTLTSAAQYVCLDGYAPSASPQIVCRGNGKWTKPKFECTACFSPPRLNHAILTGPPLGITLVGQFRLYTCEAGYLETGPIAVMCLDSLMWSKPDYGCADCGDPPPVGNGAWLAGPMTISATAQYLCLDGYAPSGPPEVICQANGRWTKPAFECTGCFAPPSLVKANVIGSAVAITLVGMSLQYTCHAGYHGTGPVTVTCLDSLTWSLPLHRCKGCEAEPWVDHGTFVPSGDTVGSVIKYTCLDGYLPTATAEVVCLDNGEWSNPHFQCVIACYNPPVYKDALLDPALYGVLVADIRRYVCDSGYLTAGDTAITCLPSGQWSHRMFTCTACPDPPLQPNAIALKGAILIGHSITYTCAVGYVATGPADITCLPEAIWTQPLIGCSKCRRPPQLEFSVPSGGPTTVGSVVTYTCRHGYISDTIVVSECLPNLKWSKPAKDCYDCGPPPKMAYAYSGMGPSAIGSFKRYSCDFGFDLTGNDVIECLPNGAWTQPKFTCTVRTTTTTTTPAPVIHNPSVCDLCRMMNGVGFIAHPTDCTMFIQCFYSGRGGIESVYQSCPFGLYWDQEDLTCKHADDVDCAAERCRNPSVYYYKHTDNTKCCAYWECENGRSVAKCCGEGYSFHMQKGCVPDMACVAVCPYEDLFAGCDKRPLMDITRFEQHIGNGYWVKMPCAPGTAYNIIDCECTDFIGFEAAYGCRPELLLDFDDGTIEDKSKNKAFIYNEGVRVYNGAAYFDGSSRLMINRFSNTEFVGDLVIKLRYKEKLFGPTANALQALLTNGDCGDDPSIIIAKMPGYVLLGAKTDAVKSFALPTFNKEWKEVIYIHDEMKLEGRVCGASDNKWSLGPIQATHCGIQIGHGSKIPNFMGLIDDIQIYQCRPPDDVLTVYGGQRFLPPPPLLH